MRKEAKRALVSTPRGGLQGVSLAALLHAAGATVGCGARTGIETTAAPAADSGVAGIDGGGDTGPLPDVVLSQSECVLYGGFPSPQQSSLADTWVYDGLTWRKSTDLVPPECMPGPGCGYIGSAVSAQDRLLFLGTASTSLATIVETFVWTGRRWERVETSNPPTARFYPAIAAFGDEVILFGGVNLPSSNYLGDTWVLRGTAWSQPALEVAPPARSNASAAGVSTVLLLFGGSNASGLLGDTWLWDGARWEVSPDGFGPSPRCGASAALGAEGVILFGGCMSGGCTGCSDGGSSNETWTWTPGNHWSLLHPPVSPAPRNDAAMGAFAVESLVLFGGFSGDETLSDTWNFDGTWYAGPGVGPPARGLAAMACE
jgi:hypothetical protein